MQETATTPPANDVYQKGIIDLLGILQPVVELTVWAKNKESKAKEAITITDYLTMLAMGVQTHTVWIEKPEGVTDSLDGSVSTGFFDEAVMLEVLELAQNTGFITDADFIVDQNGKKGIDIKTVFAQYMKMNNISEAQAFSNAINQKYAAYYNPTMDGDLLTLCLASFASLLKSKDYKKQ